jgi:hypothetical protein
LVAPPSPTRALPGAPHALATSLIHPKCSKHTPKLCPSLVSCRFKMKGREGASRGSLTCHGNKTNVTNIYKHTHPLMKCGPSFYKTEGGPTCHRGASRCHPYAARRPSVLHHHFHASMQRSTCTNALYP